MWRVLIGDRRENECDLVGVRFPTSLPALSLVLPYLRPAAAYTQGPSPIRRAPCRDSTHFPSNPCREQIVRGDAGCPTSAGSVAQSRRSGSPLDHRRCRLRVAAIRPVGASN
jgi:hypothetical protein